MRDLASIVTIEQIIPMQGKDRIVCVTFLENSYEAIVSKTDAAVGNKLVFIQEGSILPEEPKWEFLRKRCYNEVERGFIIKPMTMGKKEDGSRVKSWGLATSLADAGLSEKLTPKTDVTELLKIRKYEPESESLEEKPSNFAKFLMKHKLTRPLGRFLLNRKTNGLSAFPTDLICKSDETTLQNMKDVLEKHADEAGYVTIKLEGQSATATLDPRTKKFYVCSRNQSYRKRSNNNFWKFAIENDLEKKFKEYYKETGLIPVIQAEQCGPGIQSNIYNFDKLHWFVYRAKVIDKKEIRALSYTDMAVLACKLGLQIVPLVGFFAKLKEALPTVDAAVEFASKFYWKMFTTGILWSYTSFDKKEKLWEDYFQHEGVVVRSLFYDKEKNVGFSFKIKNLEYQEKSLSTISEKAAKNAKTKSNLA